MSQLILPFPTERARRVVSEARNLLMRTRSGLQYRPSRSGVPAWSGPNMARRTMAQRRTFARSQTLQRRRRQTSGIGITTQHDERRIYRKRSMPRFKRRRWKRFKNKVLAVSEKDLGSRTALFNATYTFGNTTGTAHNIFSIALYPNSSSTAHLNDLNTIAADEAGTWTAATGGVVDKTSKFIFKSAILDLTFRNSSTFNDGTNTLPNFNAKLETDIYEIIVNGITDDSSGTYATLQALFSSGAGDTLNIGGAGTGIGFNQRGSSPWDFPHALARWKIKILKKTKYFLSGGRTLTYQYRDPKRRVISRGRLARLQGCNLPGWTHHVMIIFKAVPGIGIGTGETDYTEKIEIGTTRKYLYNITGMNDTRDRYFANT